MSNGAPPLFLGGVPAPELVRRFGSPLYVYDEAMIRRRAREIVSAFTIEDVRFLFACKANSNPDVLRIIRSLGLSIDAVSIGEVHAALKTGFAPERISYTGNNVTLLELSEVAGLGVHVTLDSLSQLSTFGTRFPGKAVAVRINPDVGSGHHEHVITGGPDSKFGIHAGDVEDILAVAARHDLTIDGVHQHIGSGILDVADFLEAIEILLGTAAKFPDVRFVDFGGGFGVPYKKTDQPFDLYDFGLRAGRRLAEFRRAMRKPVGFRFEPGRFLVAEAGTLLATVTSIKRTAAHTFAGTDTGMHHLVRPALYGAWHEIVNASRTAGEVERYTIAGDICESGDLLGRDRLLVRLQEGDILAVKNAGAYGWSMASTYNLRPRPAEVIVNEGDARLSRRRETVDDLLDGF